MDVREKLVELLRVSPHLDVVKGYKGNDCTFEQGADWLVAHGVTVQEWISVKDRFPEENGRYLCNVKSFAFPGCFYQAILQCDKHGFREGNIYTDDVTHWMPLPEPVKEEA